MKIKYVKKTVSTVYIKHHNEMEKSNMYISIQSIAQGYEDFLRKRKRLFKVRYVLTKPKSTDFNRIQRVFSSRSG